MNAGAIITARQNKYIRQFRQVGATDADNAKTLKEVGCLNSLLFHRMVDRGVFVAAEDKRFYLNVEAAEKYLARRRKRIFLFVGVTLFVVLILWWLGRV